MPTERTEHARAEALLATLVGEHAWGSRVSADAVLRMDFGAPHLRIREPSPRAHEHEGNVRAALERRIAVPTGRWHLFVEAGEWGVRAKTEVCDRIDAESADTTRQRQVTRCLSSLDRQILRETAWIASEGLWRFTFDLGGVLSIADGVEPGATEADWTLFAEDGTILSWCRDHSFAFDRATSRT